MKWNKLQIHIKIPVQPSFTHICFHLIQVRITLYKYGVTSVLYDATSDLLAKRKFQSTSMP